MPYYPTKTPYLVRKLFPDIIFSILTKQDDKVLYLTFDDGPTTGVTEWVLEQLDGYDAKATFFCIGKKVKENEATYREVLAKGHVTGNHTFTHVDGWKITYSNYLNEVSQCAEVVDSTLFRPPYGRIGYRQLRTLKKHYKIVLMDVLTGDFDERRKPEQCYECVVKYAGPGSIILFHDSQKAFPRLQYALPKVLEHYSSLGYRFDSLSFLTKTN